MCNDTFLQTQPHDEQTLAMLSVAIAVYEGRKFCRYGLVNAREFSPIIVRKNFA